MKLYGGVWGGKRNKWLDFGSDLDDFPDSGIFKRIFYHYGIGTSWIFLCLLNLNKKNPPKAKNKQAQVAMP